MPSLETIYFIHHSHTDMGYTHDQPIVWDLNERFFDDVLACCARGSASDHDAQFRWTVESTATLWQWLQNAPAHKIDQFCDFERRGLIEVTAMFANITPLYDVDQLIESFALVRRLRDDYGFTIRHAMNCDVNGQSWSLVDILLDLGIEGFMMAVNTHYGATPFPRPNAFWWESPQGRRLLTWNGWLYISGWRFGIGHPTFDVFEQTWLPKIERHLAVMDYPHDKLLLQSAHPFGDNGSAYLGFAEFIQRWNAAGKTPHIVFATPAMWWDAFRDDAQHIPQLRGDWTDYWNFGSISSNREQAINRQSRTRLRTADALASVTAALPPSPATEQVQRSTQRYRAQAWQHLHLWDEHTWGADQAIHQPHIDDTLAQWNHKAHHAYAARSWSLLLQRDGLAALAQGVRRSDDDVLLLFNPLPTARRVAGNIGAGVLSERFLDWDISSSRHYQDRLLDVDALTLHTAKHGDQLNINATLAEIVALKPLDVPAFGYTLVKQSDLYDFEAHLTLDDAAVVETGRYRLTFDTERGGLTSWYDKALACEWVDAGSAHSFHGYVHETIEGEPHLTMRKAHYEEVWHTDEVEYPDSWKADWPAHYQRPSHVIEHQVAHTPAGITVTQHLAAPTSPAPLTLTVFIPTFADYVEFKTAWQMDLSSHPEATYVTFPFNLAHAQARLDLGGQALRPQLDQLPGVCRDYFTVQHWVDFNDGQRGVTVATPDNPLVQLGDFMFGRRQTTFELDTALFLGWVTNNYWGTNFRAHQPGEVRSRYRVRPYAGAFDEAAAHRFGAEAAQEPLLLQSLGEPQTVPPALPNEGQLLRLPTSSDPASPVLSLHAQPAADGMLLRLLNASDAPATAQVQSGLLSIERAWASTLLGAKLEPLASEDGSVTLTFAPRQIRAIIVQLGSNA